MYGCPLLTFNSTLSNFNDLLFIHTIVCSQGWTLTRLTHQHKKFARMYCNLGYDRHATSWSKPTSMASLLIRSLWPLLSCPWPMHSGVNLLGLALVLRTSSVWPIDFLSSLAMVYLCCSLTQMKLLETSETNKRNHAKVKYHQSTGSISYVVQLQTFVSGLLLLPLYKYKQKLMCNVNRRRIRGRP
jgi:hypothetical protein